MNSTTGNPINDMVLRALLGIGRGIAALLGIILCLLLFVWIYNRLRLIKEKKLLRPLGKLVDAGGVRMCVYTGGTSRDGTPAYVFMSGTGIVSPILDFRSLYSQFTAKHMIVVSESPGFGFSGDTDKDRDIDTLLEENRTALASAGVEPPYILFPHGDAGITALYWAKRYPDEVKAVIGLDISVPADIIPVKSGKDAEKTDKLFRILQKTGIIRFLIPSILSEHHGSLLTDEELAVYEALVCRRAVSRAGKNQRIRAAANAKKAEEAGRPDRPLLLYVSDGTYTGYDGEKWLDSKKEYADGCADARIITLACDHSVHNFEYERIAADTENFLSEHGII